MSGIDLEIKAKATSGEVDLESMVTGILQMVKEYRRSRVGMS